MMKRTYFYSSSQHKVLEGGIRYFDGNGKLYPPYQPTFIHGIEYTEVQEGENPKSNWDDASVVCVETFGNLGNNNKIEFLALK